MPLTRPSFTVYVANLSDDTPDQSAPAEHLVTITHQDQLRAEQALLGIGVTSDHSLALTTAWCWAALRRLQLHKGPLQRFLDVECQGVESPSQGVVAETVDPTQPEAGPDSPSPSDSAGPVSTGSQPTTS